jgi:hypothetical protein
MTETQRPARPKLSLFRKSAPIPAAEPAAPAGDGRAATAPREDRPRAA